jgi:hypothetical protein
MTRRSFITVVGLVFLGRRISMAQGSSSPTVIQFPGSCLKWLHIAEPRILEEHLKPENYMISVIEEDDHVTVVLKSLDAPLGVKGSGGTHPGYEVEIRKADSQIIRSNFLR